MVVVRSFVVVTIFCGAGVGCMDEILRCVRCAFGLVPSSIYKTESGMRFK